MRMSSAEFLQSFQKLSDKPPAEPVTITCNGADHFVLLSIEEYERLKRRDRRVLRVEEFTPEEMEAIQKTEVPPEYAYLDEELKDWTP